MAIGPWIIPVGKAVWTWNKRRRQRKRDAERSRIEAENYVRRSQGMSESPVPDKEVAPVFKGKLTYTAVLAILAPVLTATLGFDIVPEDLVPFWQAATAAVALYGRWRASR